jgi:hypothetical protein
MPGSSLKAVTSGHAWKPRMVQRYHLAARSRPYPCYERMDGATMVREDPRHFARETRRRERRALIYLVLTGAMIVAAAAAFIWWTW